MVRKRHFSWPLKSLISEVGEVVAVPSLGEGRILR
ncbi:MAG: hypothetical protein ACJAYC_000795 [Halieaceae bacterium]